MSAEEATPEPAPVTEAAAEEEPQKVETSTNKNNYNKKDRKDEVPIEELYDLSKPIPKVPKPDKAAHESELAAIEEELNKIKEDRAKIQKEIDDTLNKDKTTGAGKDREELQKLRNAKNALIEEKKVIRSKLDATKSEADKIMKDKKDAKSTIKYTDPAEIDKEIAKLQRKQETTSMSLTDEKKLIREIDTLRNSKKVITSLKEKEGAMDDVMEQRKSIQDLIKAKDKEIDDLSKQIDEKMTALKSMNDKDTEKKDRVQEWFKKRDELRQAFNDKLKEKDAAKAKYRETNNTWYNNQKAVRAQNKIKYEEERKRRESEQAEYLKKVEEEESKKIPYEAEQALCDYLADYLTNAYLKDGEEKKDEKKEDVVAVKDDPFANFKPVSKKEEDQEYFGKGKGKKKRDRSNKKQAQVGAGPFKLSVDTFEQFGLIGMNPPTALDQVEGTVTALREKKEWYSQQPRGSVPTAQEIRKQNARAAAEKLQQGKNGNAPGDKKGPAVKGGGKKFDLSTDDFAPLPGSIANVNATMSIWGKPANINSPPSAASVSADPTPEEAAAAQAS